MSFSWNNFVRKSTRGLFLFIVICMVVPLVLWGYMGKSGDEKEEDQGPAGTIHGTITVAGVPLPCGLTDHEAFADESSWSSN